MKIKIGDTKTLGSSSIREACKTGRILGGNYGRGTLTIMIAGVFGSKTFINKEVFKQALIQNQEFIKQEFGLVVMEATMIPTDKEPIEVEVTDEELDELDNEVLI